MQKISGIDSYNTSIQSFIYNFFPIPPVIEERNFNHLYTDWEYIGSIAGLWIVFALLTYIPVKRRHVKSQVSVKERNKKLELGQIILFLFCVLFYALLPQIANVTT